MPYKFMLKRMIQRMRIAKGDAFSSSTSLAELNVPEAHRNTQYKSLIAEIISGVVTATLNPSRLLCLLQVWQALKFLWSQYT